MEDFVTHIEKYPCIWIQLSRQNPTRLGLRKTLRKRKKKWKKIKKNINTTLSADAVTASLTAVVNSPNPSWSSVEG
ncbi:hypothetical protein EVAR_82397_1 [Eumeta japonica]|uniref:Uncharacterized protein n=1 Tax=Eumeta variegata TaxID=151549 RepID=A0A4C1UA22_EUMVA|nr:hypothetical protein EVAR_82397_1 [Eumeta japonica]